MIRLVWIAMSSSRQVQVSVQEVLALTHLVRVSGVPSQAEVEAVVVNKQLEASKMYSRNSNLSSRWVMKAELNEVVHLRQVKLKGKTFI